MCDSLLFLGGPNNNFFKVFRRSQDLGRHLSRKPYWEHSEKNASREPLRARIQTEIGIFLRENDYESPLDRYAPNSSPAKFLYFQDLKNLPPKV